MKQSKLHFLFYLHSHSIDCTPPSILFGNGGSRFFSPALCLDALTLFHLTNKSPLLMGNLRAMPNLFDYTIPFIANKADKANVSEVKAIFQNVMHHYYWCNRVFQYFFCSTLIPYPKSHFQLTQSYLPMVYFENK